MDLQSRKINFVQEFLKLDNEDAVKKLEKLLKREKSRLLSERLSMDEFNSMIDNAEDDAKNNRRKDVRQLKNEIKFWK